MLLRALKDPSVLFLLAGNIYCIWYFSGHPDGFPTVIWIYWSQSVIIGLFNFVDLYTLKNFNPGDMKLNDRPVEKKDGGCIAWFFLLHYGTFHFVYSIFLLVNIGISKVSKEVYLLGIAAFIAEAVIAFIQRKKQEREQEINIGSAFFLPYLRVIPMHLTIIAPAFFGMQPSMIFLALKTVADILSYLLYHTLFSKKRL